MLWTVSQAAWIHPLLSRQRHDRLWSLWLHGAQPRHGCRVLGVSSAGARAVDSSALGCWVIGCDCRTCGLPGREGQAIKPNAVRDEGRGISTEQGFRPLGPVRPG
jgi:hypothetical protein